MAATACARPPQVVLVPADTFTHVDGTAVETLPAPVPPPPLPRPSKVPPSFMSHHLDICTEGLGSESSGDIDLSDLNDDVNNNDKNDGGCVDVGVGVGVGQALSCKRQHCDGGDEELGRARSASRPAFPPPISLIGAGGKPWLYLRPQRKDGRLVLREVRIPSRELLQARREDGRFKLQYAQPQPDQEDKCQEAQHQDPAE